MAHPYVEENGAAGIGDAVISVLGGSTYRLLW
jgi:hypothetical protein